MTATLRVWSARGGACEPVWPARKRIAPHCLRLAGESNAQALVVRNGDRSAPSLGQASYARVYISQRLPSRLALAGDRPRIRCGFRLSTCHAWRETSRHQRGCSSLRVRSGLVELRKASLSKTGVPNGDARSLRVAGWVPATHRRRCLGLPAWTLAHEA